MDDDGLSCKVTQVELVRRMQSHFVGCILRHMHESVTWNGKPLLDLPPCLEIHGILTLTQQEMDILNERAEAAKAR